MPILESERVRSAKLRLVWRSDAVSCNEAMVHVLVNEQTYCILINGYSQTLTVEDVFALEVT